MPRYKLVVEYDGGPFAGWQRQENGPSVQAALEEAVFKLSQERVTLTGAGRTDAGVHARGQVAHFDLVKEFPADKVRDALNAHLRPAPVSVIEAAVAAADFHARFSAVARHYEYRMLCRRAPPALGSRACLAYRAQARCGRDGRGRAHADRHARLHHVPLVRVPGEIAGEIARPVRCLRAGR